ncbi:MAG TPA: rhodanese-like domain-containing protein [Isosphaeraceae bacterium]|nr:rhodanese-like domain-containing protein [Isosphaeraceae bacterium]
MEISTIAPARLAERIKSGQAVDLIDVRTPAEYREVHIQGARSVPLDRLEPRALMESREDRRGEPLFVVCRSGSRGKKACEVFLEAGFPEVINVEGGTLAWEAAGLPVNRGKKTISLERQVRIAAGSLVVLGSGLAAAVSPWFLLLSGFVGAGLVFAGLTDTCGMGLLLAKMPWNQVAESPSKNPEAATCSR